MWPIIFEKLQLTLLPACPSSSAGEIPRVPEHSEVPQSQPAVKKKWRKNEMTNVLKTSSVSCSQLQHNLIQFRKFFYQTQCDKICIIFPQPSLWESLQKGWVTSTQPCVTSARVWLSARTTTQGKSFSRELGPKHSLLATDKGVIPCLGPVLHPLHILFLKAISHMIINSEGKKKD